MKLHIAVAAALVTMSSLPVVAQTSNADTATAPALQRGSTVNNKANANERSPGAAKEMEPDSKQSATGGPAGGGTHNGATGGN